MIPNPIERKQDCGHFSAFPIKNLCENCARRIMLKPLRWYQIEAIRQVYKCFYEGYKSVCLGLPTGAGKTRTVVEIILQIYRKRIKQPELPQSRFVCLSHRKELKEQMQVALSEIGLEDKIQYVDPSNKDYQKIIQIATIQTLARRLDNLPECDLLIIDEGHRAKAKSYVKVIEEYKKKGTLVIIITATPTRLDRKPLNDIAEKLVYPLKIKDLIQQGYLRDYKVFSKFTPNLKGIRKKGGDYDREELENVMNCISSNNHVLEEYKRIGNNRKTIFFCVTVEHAVSLCKLFQKNGFSSTFVHGGMVRSEREKAIKGYKEGRFRQIFNVEILTEGFDDPATSCVGLVRPTQSLTLQLQMIGRCLRIHEEEKDALILDFSGNVEYHGLPCQDHNWQLFFKEGYNKNSNEHNPPELRVKTCEECFRILPSNVRTCDCGFSFDLALGSGKSYQEVLDLPLKEIVKTFLEEEIDDSDRILKLISKSRGYKKFWESKTKQNFKNNEGNDFYFRNIFRNIIQFEFQNDYILNPDCDKDIEIVSGLDDRFHSWSRKEENERSI